MKHYFHSIQPIPNFLQKKSVLRSGVNPYQPVSEFLRLMLLIASVFNDLVFIGFTHFDAQPSQIDPADPPGEQKTDEVIATISAADEVIGGDQNEIKTVAPKVASPGLLISHPVSDVYGGWIWVTGGAEDLDKLDEWIIAMARCRDACLLEGEEEI